MSNGTIYLSNGHPPGPRVMAVPGPLRPEAADDATDGSSNHRPHEPETNGAKTNGAKTNGAKPISQKKLEANRRNAQQSTGPRTEEGKGTSSMNALKHGLLAQGVITRGDYREDPIEYLELLEALKKEWRVKGPIEEEDLEHMALLRWRRRRAVRFEVGTIEQRTLGTRQRAEGRRKERVDEELSLGPGAVEMLEQHAAGVKYILDVMRAVRTNPSSGTPPGRDLEWLITEYPADFAPDQPHERDDRKGGETGMWWTEEYGQRVRTALDRHLQRLTPRWIRLAEFEEQLLEAAIDAAGLLDEKEVLRLTRYEKTIDHLLGRTTKRLEATQRRRRFGQTQLGNLFP
jgi:hypothetical protein